MQRLVNFKKIKIFIIIQALLISVLAMSGCNDEEKDGSGYSFTYTLLQNPQNLDPQLATDKSSLMIIENMFLGLMTFNVDGKLDCGLAVDYEIAEDGLKYHFNLRDNCYWYSAGGTEELVTAHDFVYSFKRIFNPETLSPYTEKFSFLKNAKAIISGEIDYSQLGVYAINSTELVFELDSPCSEFLYLLTTAPAMPCNKDFFEGTKARYGLDEESVISNGAFYMTQWSYDPYGNDNLIYMKRNYDNSQYDKVYPYMLTFIIEKQEEAAAENFDNASTDCFVSETPYKKSLLGTSETDKYGSTSMGMIFNNRCDIDTDVKKALSLSIDREKYAGLVTNRFDVAYGIIPGNMGVSDINYRERYNQKDIDFYSEDQSLSQSRSDDFNEQFPDGVELMVRNKSDNGFVSQIAADWQEKLDIYIKVSYVDDSEYYQRLDDKDYEMAFVEMTMYDNSIYYFFDNIINNINCESGKLNTLSGYLKDSIVCTSADEALKIYSEVENEIICDGDYIPVFYNNSFMVRKKGVKDLIYNPFSEQINFRYAKYFD